MVFVCAGMTSAVAQAGGQNQSDGESVFPYDPVALIRDGTETGGSDELAVRRGLYTYRFASAENKSAFEREPARYEIQLGGACARMGALSGACRCDLYAVHAGKLYLFASPQCRDTFKKTPETFIERDDPPVSADAEARQRGRELFDLALKAHGGAERIDALRAYRQTIESSQEYQGKDYRTDQIFTIAFPDRARDQSHWGDRFSANVCKGAAGAFITEKGLDRPMVESQRRALQRSLNRNLLVIFRARNRPDFAAAETGRSGHADGQIARVAVSFDGTTFRLGIDARTGRIHTLEYTALGGERFALGSVEKTFVDWTTVDGVVVPTAWTVKHDGVERAGPPVRLARVEIDPKLDASLFQID